MTKENKKTLSSEEPEKIIAVLENEIIELTRENKKLKQDQFFFNTLLDNIPVSIYFKNTKSQFLRASKSLAKRLGKKSEKDLLGKTDFDFFNDSHAQKAYKDEQIILKTGEPITNYEEKESQPNGQFNWVSTSKMPLRDDSNHIVGTFGLSKDITELKLAKEESKTKQQFLANMSHEIRTPLNAILGLTDITLKTQLEAEQRKHLEIISNSGKNLLVIINDILDLSKLQVKKLSLELLDFDFNLTITHLIAGFQNKANEKGINLSCQIDHKIPMALVGDAVRLSQILTNLLGNAIKFTNEGSVRLDCVLQKEYDGLNYIQFLVSDTGIGIKDTSSIFDSFEQENMSIGTEFGGTGLGLAICRELVELFRGSIEVSSVYEKGSTFAVTIPFPTGDEKKVNKKNSEIVSDHDVKNCKVLLVDDHNINRIVAETVLFEAGMLVTTAVNGQESLLKLQEEKFDIVLMDLRMPVMNGLEATRQIRKKLQLNIPIIALTANAMKGERQKCLKEGMDDYLSKPFNATELVKKIALLLDKKVDKDFKETQSTFDTNKKLYDLSQLNAMTSNQKLQLEIVELFIKDTHPIVAEIKRYFYSNKIEDLKETAHKLKASIDILQITNLKLVIRSLEKIPDSFNSEEYESKVILLEKITNQVIHQLKIDFKINAF